MHATDHSSLAWTHTAGSIRPGIGEARPVAAKDAIVAHLVIMAMHMSQIYLRERKVTLLLVRRPRSTRRRFPG